MSITTLQYLHEHGLTLEDATRFGLEIKENKISIPIKNKDGKIIFWKHRHFGGNVKYTYDKGASIALFGAEQVRKPGSSIFIVEGEFDAMKLRERGACAYSTTGGSMSWQPEWGEFIKNMLLKDRQLFFVPGRVKILYDRDDPGARGTYRVWSALQDAGVNASIGALPINSGKDVCEYLYLQRGMNQADIRTVAFITLSDKYQGKNKVKKCVALRNIIKEIEIYQNTHPEHYHILSIFHAQLVAELRFLNRKPAKILGTNLESIKKVPITNYVHFRNGVALCVFHSDKNPSMVYNTPESSFPNTVKCFSCGKFGSVIDVVMAINGCDFKKAVEIIKQRNTN